MAKKRVHEIAKEKGIPSKEVIAVLQKAGLDVKAAASSVDEADIARAFANGADAADGAGAAADAPAKEAAPKAEAPKRARRGPAGGASGRCIRGGRPAGAPAPHARSARRRERGWRRPPAPRGDRL